MHLNYHLQSHINSVYYPLNLPKNQLNYNRESTRGSHGRKGLPYCCCKDLCSEATACAIPKVIIARIHTTTESQNDLFIGCDEANEANEILFAAIESNRTIAKTSKQIQHQNTTIIDTKCLFLFYLFYQ